MLPGDKEQRTDAVEQQTEYHTPAVSEATDEKSCRNGHNEVSHIHRHLYKGRMCLRDIQYLLKVLVQYIRMAWANPHKKKREVIKMKGTRYCLPTNGIRFCFII